MGLYGLLLKISRVDFYFLFSIQANKNSPLALTSGLPLAFSSPGIPIQANDKDKNSFSVSPSPEPLAAMGSC